MSNSTNPVVINTAGFVSVSKIFFCEMKMFANLPFDLTSHAFVTSGNLALWAEYQTRLSYGPKIKSGQLTTLVNKDLKHRSTKTCLEQALIKKVLGTSEFAASVSEKCIPEIYLDVIKSVVTKSISRAVESGRLAENDLDDGSDSVVTDRVEYYLEQAAVEIEFCSDFLLLIRKLFVLQGVKNLRAADKYKARQALRFLADIERRKYYYDERRIRISLKTKTRLHSILDSLSPFVYDAERERHYKKYTVNELGLELWHALEREFYSTAVFSDQECENTLSANQMLLLLALNRAAHFDLIDSCLFDSVISLVTQCPVTLSNPRIWSTYQDVIGREFTPALRTLLQNGLIQKRSRQDGQINNHAVAYWLELTELGCKAVESAFLVEDHIKGIRDLLVDAAVDEINSFESTDRKDILRYALAMKAKQKSWSEVELRESLSTEKSMSSFVYSLYPLIVLDESHYGKGHRYVLSAFGALVAEKLNV